MNNHAKNFKQVHKAKEDGFSFDIQASEPFTTPVKSVERPKSTKKFFDMGNKR